VYRENKKQHSKKPQYYRELLNRQFPLANKIELFARGLPTNGWDTWGNEAIGGIDLFDKQTKVE
jgi:N6-adenosine-specific RNA methylase IME4